MNCPVCNSVNTVGSRFCSNCGSPLGQVAPAPARPVEGERRLVTVLFADVVDSTRLAEKAGAEEWAEVMNGAFAFMNAAVKSYGGTVGRLMGDAILAFFGAPLAHEDDAERAVRAALELRDAASEYEARLRVSHPRLLTGERFAVRTGINSGLSVLATVGDDIKAEYTAMGDTANLAARLQGLAKPGMVLIGQDTYALVRHAFDIAPLGLQQVKGRQEPIATYEVLGLSQTPTRRRGIEGLVSPLVGRELEMKLLRERLEDLEQAKGSFVCVVGEAGLGKSRMVSELRQRARGASGVRWIEGRSLSYTQAMPYYPWRAVILASLGATDADAPDVIRQRFRASTQSAAWGDDRHGAYLEVLMGVEDEATAAEVGELDRGGLGAKMTAAATAYLEHLAASGPTVVVFEDLHWADAASVELLVSAAERVRDQPLLLLVVMRPDRQAPSWSMREVVRARAGDAFLDLRLEPLSEAGSKELLGNLLVRDLPVATAELILSKSDGNPFYLEEVLRSLIDSGHIVREHGGWRASKDIVDVTIPDTLSGVLSARIDLLPEQTRQVAQTAAVIGRTFGRSVLNSVLEDDPLGGLVGELMPHLDTLTVEELVRELSRESDQEYSFKHALTQEAAYDRLLLRRRRELHQRVGRVLERMYGERAEEIAAVLAHHFARGEESWATARYASTAARRARLLYALPEALRLYLEAVTALERLEAQSPPESVSGPALADRQRLYVDSLLGWLEAAANSRLHEQLDSREHMLRRGEKAVELSRILGDTQRLTKSLVTHGANLVLSGFPGSGFEPLVEAHRLADELGDDGLFLLPFWAMTELMANDDPKGAADQFAQVAEMARRVGNKSVEAHALGTRAMTLARIGEFGESLRIMPLALAAAEASSSIIKLSDVNMLIGGSLMDMGESELGLAYVEYGTNKALSIGGKECASTGLWMTGVGKMGFQLLDQALGFFDSSLEVGTGTGCEIGFYNVRASRASCEFKQGKAAAVHEIEPQIRLAETMNDGLGVATANHELGDALVELGRLDQAEPRLLSALKWYRERFMRPYVVRVLRSLAELRDAQDRPAEAAAAREEAREIKQAMDRLIDHSVLEALRAASPRPDMPAVPAGASRSDQPGASGA